MSAEEWSRHATIYARSHERSTWLWAQDALTIAGLQDVVTEPRRLLDVACGPGRFAVAVAKLGFEVTATDMSLGMLETVQQNANAASVNIETAVADGQTLEGLQEEAFDVVTSIFGIFLFSNRVAGWSAALRVLKPGGRLLTTAWAAPGNTFAAIGKYVLEHAVELPIEDPNAQGNAEEQAVPLRRKNTMEASGRVITEENTFVPFNATGKAEAFATELRDCGFVHVSVHTVHHDMCYSSGKELVEFMLDNAMMAPKLRGRDLRSVKICMLHYLDLLKHGIDANIDSQAPRPPRPDEGITAEHLPLWHQPVIVPRCAHIAIAEKPM